jgi:hypothetical protein
MVPYAYNTIGSVLCIYEAGLESSNNGFIAAIMGAETGN